MNLDLLLHPLMQFILLAAGLVACLYIILVTNTELYSLKRKSRRYQLWTESAIRHLESRLADAQRSQQRPLAAELAAEIDPALRIRVVELARKGFRAERIASILALPPGEVQVVMNCSRSVLQLDGDPIRHRSRRLPMATARAAER